MPWTDIWTKEFKSDSRDYSKLEHCMINIIAKAGKILQRIEMSDHYGPDYSLGLNSTEDARDLAIIIMSALKSANVYPGQILDMEKEIIRDLQRRKVDLSTLDTEK